MMRCFLGLGLAVTLAGCATGPFGTPWSDDGRREARLLQENDLIQAKMLVAAADPDGYELADALLTRAGPKDKTGETEFYRAVLMIRQEAQPDDIVRHLERAAKKEHPHAIALLYKVYNEPYLVDNADPEKAAQYRTAYGGLNVAKSGYPSFQKALDLVSALVANPPAMAIEQAATPDETAPTIQ